MQKKGKEKIDKQFHLLSWKTLKGCNLKSYQKKMEKQNVTFTETWRIKENAGTSFFQYVICIIYEVQNLTKGNQRSRGNQNSRICFHQ